MESCTLNRNCQLQFVYLMGIIMLFAVGCHTNDPILSDDESTSMTDENVSVPVDLNSEFPDRAVAKLKAVVMHTMQSNVSDTDMNELKQILNYLNDAEKKGPAYFDDSKNLVKFLETGRRVSQILARLNPDNFNVQLNLSMQYLSIGRSFEQIQRYDPSKETGRLSREYRKKGIKLAEELVIRFPGQGVAYGHLAHTLYTTGGDRQRSLSLYKRCLELDSELRFCQEGYNALLEK